MSLLGNLWKKVTGEEDFAIDRWFHSRRMKKLKKKQAKGKHTKPKNIW